MDITSFLTRAETIAGLEISDSYIRLCFFTQNKKDGSSTISLQKEQELPKGVIKNGIIQDDQAVIETLKTLFEALPQNIRYVIATIPAQATYIKVFGFPKAIQGKKLEETMNLTIGFQLPIKTEDVYIDWEAAKDSESNEVVLAAAKKAVIDQYIAILIAAKLNPVAIEPHIFAVLRAINITEEAHTLIVDETSTDDILFWIAHKGTVRFVRSLPSHLVDQKEEEIRKIAAFYEAEHHVVPTVIQSTEMSLLTTIKEKQDTLPENVWLASIGAARRGIIPRAQDSLISLMPIGTVKAYKRHQAISFVEFVANTTVGIAAFFSIAFVGVWFLMSSLQQQTLIQIENLNALPISPDTAELEAHAQTLNGLTSGAHQALQKIPLWSTILEEIRKRSTQGIIVTNATFPSPEDIVTITGTAANREQLTAFKKTMEASDLFTEVSLPSTNLELREAIPFSLSFKLKDPTTIYEK